MTTSPATIDSLSRDILAQVAPDEVRLLPLTAEQIFAGGAASRRAMRHALETPGGGDRPAGFGGAHVVMVAGFLLTVLNGVACDLLKGGIVGGTGRLRARLRARSRRRALTARVAAGGPAAPLPGLTAVQAAQVGAHVLDLARGAGIAEETAQRIATLLAASLQKP